MDNTNQYRHVLVSAIKEFGQAPQLDMVVEECAELIKAINKLKRRGFNKGEYLPLVTDLLSEVADVRIMLDQVEVIFENVNSKEIISYVTKQKIERLTKRITDKQNGKKDNE